MRAAESERDQRAAEEAAPRVEALTTEWQKTGEGKFRICDWDVYDAQMLELIGLDPRSDPSPVSRPG